VIIAAAVSITAATTHTQIMRDPASLLAGRSCAILLRFSLDDHARTPCQSASRSNAATINLSTVAVWR
jgi:hypothetical protein